MLRELRSLIAKMTAVQFVSFLSRFRESEVAEEKKGLRALISLIELRLRFQLEGVDRFAGSQWMISDAMADDFSFYEATDEELVELSYWIIWGRRDAFIKAVRRDHPELADKIQLRWDMEEDDPGEPRCGFHQYDVYGSNYRK